MRLWLAEKASAGRDIALALGGGRENGGSIALKNGDVVTWARGHLLESLMPHDYDPIFQKWALEHLPIIPDRFLRKPAPTTVDILKGICRLLGQAKEVVIASDAGREGEAIAWFILEHAKWKGPVLRFWTSSLNQSHLRTAVHNLIDGNIKKPLYVAARLRSSADWLDGVNYSRYYQLRSASYGDKVISVGRVQTATLALVVDRDLEIENFVSTDYYELRAGMDTPAGPLDLFHKRPKEKRLVDRAEADALAQRAHGARTTLKVEAKPKTFVPPPPFSLPELQIAASSRWGWTAKRTLDTLQSLYEKGAVTYPRTDSSCLTDDMKADMPNHLAALRKRRGFEKLADIDPVIRSSVFNSKKVDDHHGIITTSEAVDIAGLSADAVRLFDLVARRFLAALMPDAKGTTTTISADLNGVPFRTSGLIINEPGWKAVWGKDEEPSGDAKKDEDDLRVLPPVKDGDPASAREIEIFSKRTEPPSHYTDGTLLKAMINVGGKADDAEVRELLAGGGIGTQATRDSIIEKIKFRSFVRTEGKKIISTQRGREFIAILRADGNRLADPLATADLERQLRAVEKDPALAGPLWHKIVEAMRDEIARLKRGPAPRKLTPLAEEPRRQSRSSSGSPASGRKKPARRSGAGKPRRNGGTHKKSAQGKTA